MADDQETRRPLSDKETKDLVGKIQSVLTPDLLKPKYRKMSEGEHPTFGHCGSATQAAYYMLGGEESGYVPQVANLGDGTTHWWLRHRDTGHVIDPTKEQFTSKGKKPPYDLGRGCGFSNPNPDVPSKRGQEIINRIRGRSARASGGPVDESDIASPLPAEEIGIDAYHSSPHKFDKFDISKIGTGQGAQSYGYGMYFAESPAVSGRGGSYDREFTAKNLSKYDLNQQEEHILRLMNAGKSDTDVLYDLAKMGSIPRAADGLLDFEQAEAAIERIKKNRSNIYEVRINAHPDKFLDWDKPLSEQEYASSLLSKIVHLTQKEKENLPIANVLEILNPSRVEQSKILFKAGIPGIKYLDAGSRGAGKGTQNYVVFDDKLINIKRRYEIGGAVPMASGGKIKNPISREQVFDIAHNIANHALELGYKLKANIDENHPYSSSQTKIGNSAYIPLVLVRGRRYIAPEIRVSDHSVGPQRFGNYIHILNHEDVSSVKDWLSEAKDALEGESEMPKISMSSGGKTGDTQSMPQLTSEQQSLLDQLSRAIDRVYPAMDAAEARQPVIRHEPTMPGEPALTREQHQEYNIGQLQNALARIPTDYPTGPVGYAEGGSTRKGISDWKWKPLSRVREKIGVSEIPSHVQDFGNFMDETASKASGEGLSARDLIKAYTITRSSIRRAARKADTVRNAGLNIPDSITGMVRPEGAFGHWLHTSYGQNYLNDAEKGRINEDAIKDAVRIMRPFGGQNQLVDALTWAVNNLPGQEKKFSELVSRAQQMQSSPSEWRELVKPIRGIRESKAGFMASMIGRGDQPTLDARQIVLHTGRPSDEASKYLSRSGAGASAVDRLARRQKALDLTIPQNLSPYYQHLAHHTIWDKVGNETTTHQDVIDAMRGAASGGAISSPILSHPVASAMRALGFKGIGGEESNFKKNESGVVSRALMLTSKKA